MLFKMIAIDKNQEFPPPNAVRSSFYEMHKRKPSCRIYNSWLPVLQYIYTITTRIYGYNYACLAPPSRATLRCPHTLLSPKQKLNLSHYHV